MKKSLLISFLIILCCISTTEAKTTPIAITLSDNAEVSLLTSTPWDGEIYALFGHTAIRIKDTIKVESLGSRPLDIVFNYGLFSFNTPNFIFRFVKGETDYVVGDTPFEYYLHEYQERGVGVIEQILNLTQEEKQDIFDALLVNSLPENREYRYNFFYDNCATRPRDIIEKHISGKVEYTPTNKVQTYRDLLWECIDMQPWSRFGIDLVIGADADKIITDREKDFLPQYLMRAYQGATIKGDSTARSLVKYTSNILEVTLDQSYFTILKKDGISTKKTIDAPFIIGCLLLIFMLLLSIITYKSRRFVIAQLFDTLLFTIAGLGGCIIFFLMFFSEHPCTNPNWNIVWLNPLQLLVAFLFFVKRLSKCVYYYHFINFASLCIFLLAWCLVPQQLEIAFIPYILSIAIRSGMNILQYRNINKKADYSLPRTR